MRITASYLIQCCRSLPFYSNLNSRLHVCMWLWLLEHNLTKSKRANNMVHKIKAKTEVFRKRFYTNIFKFNPVSWRGTSYRGTKDKTTADKKANLLLVGSNIAESHVNQSTLNTGILFTQQTSVCCQKTSLRSRRHSYLSLFSQTILLFFGRSIAFCPTHTHRGGPVHVLLN